MACPGQGRTATVDPGGVTMTMTMAMPRRRASPPTAAKEPTMRQRSVRSRARKPPMTMPMVSHTGVMPGPPGWSRSTS